MLASLREFYDTGRLLNEEPPICLFEDFISEREIDALLTAAKDRLKRALVSATGSGVKSKGRTGRNCWVPHTHNEVIASLSQRVSETVGIPLEYAESLQVVHYHETEQYAPHYDAWDANTERGQRCMTRGGQRLLTCLIYLNQPKEGGSTAFPKLDLEVSAQPGRMLLFHNCYKGNTVRHPHSLHGGMPVTRGEKWACNFWFRERVYQR